MSILGKLFGFLGGDKMAVIDRVLVGESLVGDGNEVAHVDLIMGPRGSAAEAAFCNALTNNKDGFTSLLAVVAPNLACKPSTILFNKVLKMVQFLQMKQMISLFRLVFSFIGLLKMTQRSKITTIKQ